MKLKALDKEKLMLRIGLRALHSLYKSAAEIHADVWASQDPLVANLRGALALASDQIGPLSQRAVFQEAGEFALWMLARDSAYRDPIIEAIYWVSADVYDDTPGNVYEMVQPSRKTAREWYINQAPHMTKEELTHEEEFKRYVTSRVSEQEQRKHGPES